MSQTRLRRVVLSALARGLRATGSPMTMAPYLAYLRTKYGELYRLPQL